MRAMITLDNLSRMVTGGRMTPPEVAALVDLEKVRWKRRRNFRIWILEQVFESQNYFCVSDHCIFPCIRDVLHFLAFLFALNRGLFSMGVLECTVVL